MAADVTERAQMEEVFQQTKAHFGTLNGVLHAAGLPGAGIMQLKQVEDAARVLAPKVEGTLVLSELLQDSNLDFFYLFSSITAITGGPGQVDYTAANAFLDAFAHANSQEGCFTASINWDAWQKIGMAVDTASLRKATGATGFQSIAHPLLTQYRSEAPGKTTFVTPFSPHQHWVLGEHRVAGTPTIPGAAYPELAYAAFTHLQPARSLEIRDLLFMTPFMVREQETRELHISIEEGTTEAGWTFRVSSMTGAQSQEHVLGNVRALHTSSSTSLDLDAIRARCTPVALEGLTINNKMAAFVDVGPRWDCVRSVYAGQNEGLALLELAAPFAQDLQQYSLHPALMDIATSFAIQALGEGNYLPLSYRQLRIYRAMPATVYCYVRVPADDSAHKETVLIDVQIMDEQGKLLVDIEGFAVKRVSDEALERLYATAKQGDAASTPQDLAHALLPEEGVEAFARILAYNTLPQLVVSTRDLATVIEAMQDFDPLHFFAEARTSSSQGNRYPRPSLSVLYVAPRNALEQQIADLWQGVLGLEEVGIHDNFFELGGDSLLGTQIMVKARELGLSVTPSQFFQYQTIAELAELVGPAGESTPPEAVETVMGEEQLLANLDTLSEEEVDALLAGMMVEEDQT
ncbi:MAG: polyketide synthase dehydratase domain-containing protein [Ardenticatenales bacterium]|nr:polyketide synthase dehydratase domain-containing protein [Ardenticatenales bacterium]